MQRKTTHWNNCRKSPNSKGGNGYPSTQEALRNLNRKRAETLSMPHHSKDAKNTKQRNSPKSYKGAGEKTLCRACVRT